MAAVDVVLIEAQAATGAFRATRRPWRGGNIQNRRQKEPGEDNLFTINVLCANLAMSSGLGLSYTLGESMYNWSA